MLGKSHTDANSLRDKHTSTHSHIPHRDKYSHTWKLYHAFILIHRVCTHAQVYVEIQQNHNTHTHEPLLNFKKQKSTHTYIGILYLCPHPNRKQRDINIKDAIIWLPGWTCQYEGTLSTVCFTVYSCQSQLTPNKTWTARTKWFLYF